MQRLNYRRLSFLFALLVLVGYTTPVTANGAYSHIHISQISEKLLPAGPLRDLLSDPQLVNWYEAGSMFPDSGYAANDDYGERAHWAPFHNAYLLYLKKLYGNQYTSLEAKQHVAFLLGAMSHGLADQIYDTTLLARAFEVDGDPLGDIDRLADYFLILDQGVDIDTKSVGHFDVISSVFLTRSYTVTTDTLSKGMGLMQSVMLVQRNLAKSFYLSTWNNYPWLGTHIYNPVAPGSLPHLGELVAELWKVAWKRLHGTDSMDTDLVIASIPKDGSENFTINEAETEAYSRIGIVFGYAIKRSQAGPLIELQDPDGKAVPIDIRSPYSGETRNFLMIDPKSDLAYDTLYTVVIKAGVENLNGVKNTKPYSFTFRTRCAPDKLNDCPPLPDALVTGSIPTQIPGTSQPDSSVEDDTDAVDTDEPDQTTADLDDLTAPRDSTADDIVVPEAVQPDTATTDGSKRPDTAVPDSQTSADTGTSAKGGGGCQLGGSNPPQWPLFLLLLIAIWRVCRRRSAHL